jgi:hypothetical protein
LLFQPGLPPGLFALMVVGGVLLVVAAALAMWITRRRI